MSDFTSARDLPIVMPTAQPQQPQQPNSNAFVQRSTASSVLVSPRQKGNPVLSYIKNVAYEFRDIVCDYQVGATTGVLYLSLRYHLLHPEYIHGRITKVGQSYTLRVLLILCDADNHSASIRELTKISIVNGYTVIVAWSPAEAAKYIESYKQLERKPPDAIKERVNKDYVSQMNATLTNVRGVNTTDVMTLISNCGNLKNIMMASPDDLALLPGLGQKKVKRIRDACEANFLIQSKQK